MAQYRNNRISEEIKKSLDRIVREELRDPRISGTFSITRVDVTRDLRYAKVYVSVLEEGKLDGMVKALNGAAGFLRHELSASISIRYTPELSFYPDLNIAYGLHIADVLKKVLPKEVEDPGNEGN